MWWRRRTGTAPESAVDASVPLIRLEGIGKTFKGDDEEAKRMRSATSRVDIGRGEYVSVSGPSGCGKSTLLSILGAARLADERTLLAQRPRGRPAAARRARARAQRRVGLIFQSFNLIGDMTVYENVEYPLTLRGVTGAGAGRARPRRRSSASASPPGPSSGPARCRAATSSWSRSRAPSPGARRSCWPTSRPATSTRRAAMRSCRCSRSCTPAAPPVLATHDPRYIALAQRHIYLFDGRVVASAVE